MSKSRIRGVFITAVAAAVVAGGVVVGLNIERNAGASQDPALSVQKASTKQTGNRPKATISHKPVVEQTKKMRVVTDPNNILVVANMQHMLSGSYVPPDLVTPNIPFLSNGDPEGHLMRKVAVPALLQMFAAAKRDGIYLAGVSGYRSYGTQDWVYHNYIKTLGYKAAIKYSLPPGASEHQTGLAIDVSGSTGLYAAEPAFATTPEAKWLAANVDKYGFIIRYPKGKKAYTGIDYESWHIRYVGKAVAEFITKHGLALEQYVAEYPPKTAGSSS